jgi:hypothetical protein
MIGQQIKISIQGDPHLDKQTRFALASALTLTAKDAQTEVRNTIRGNFQIRNDWDVRGPLAIKVRPATKTDLAAWVGTGFVDLEKFMRQESGVVVDLPQGRFFAVPTKNVKRTKRELIRAAQRPRALLGKRDFIIKTKARGVLVLYQRQGRGHNSRMVAMYVLVPARRIREVDVLFGPTMKVFEKRFAPILEQQLKIAFATAK